MTETNRAHFRPGDEHPKFAGGTHISDKGYVRISVGRRSMPYEHRYRIEQLMTEQEIIRRVRLVLRGGPKADPWLEGKRLPRPQRIAREVLDVLSNPPRIPPDMHVHHIDGDKTHNCPENLMLLDQVLHDYITQAHRKFLRRAEDERIRAVLRGEGDSYDPH